MFKKVFGIFLIGVMLLLVSCGGSNSISDTNNDDLQTNEIIEQKENSYKYGDSFKILNLIYIDDEFDYVNSLDNNGFFNLNKKNLHKNFYYDLRGNAIENENYNPLFFGKYIKSFDENNRKYGLKDEIGNVLLGFDYDSMYIRGNYIDAFNFAKDMLYIYDSDLKLIFKNKFYRVVGDGCRWPNSVKVENTEYTASPILTNGLINITNKNGKWGYVNLDGKTIIKFNYDYADVMSKYGYASVAGKNKQGEMKFGLIDRKGNLVIDYQYDKPIFYNPNGIMHANKNGVGYYVNINNEQILNGLKFEETKGFIEGLAPVKMNGKWGFIDKNGSEVIPCIFKHLTNFNNGISLAAYKNYVVVLTYLDELPNGFTNSDVDLSYTKLSQIGNDDQNWINFRNKIENKINTKEWSDIDYENDFNYTLTYKDVQPDAWYVTDAGIWYYFENDRTTTKKGWFVDERDGQTYYLDSKNGRMAVGWTEIDGKMFYFNESHNNEPNWYEIGNGFYESYGKKVKAYGSMFKDEQTPDGYYVDANGVKGGSGTSSGGTSSNDSTNTNSLSNNNLSSNLGSSANDKNMTENNVSLNVTSNSLNNNLASMISNAKCITDYSADTTVDQMDTITFGHDDENDPIEWIVLEKQGNKALLLSKYLLISHKYNDEYVDITWENSTCRKWLNSEFMNLIFSKKEQGSILTTDVVNSDNARYGASGGNNTKDKLFLLSIDEFNKYFNEGDQSAARYKSGVGVWWWLRSPGDNQNDAAFVHVTGRLFEDGGSVVDVGRGIRPALWVSKPTITKNGQDISQAEYDDVKNKFNNMNDNNFIQNTNPGTNLMNGNSSISDRKRLMIEIRERINNKEELSSDERDMYKEKIGLFGYSDYKLDGAEFDEEGNLWISENKIGPDHYAYGFNIIDVESSSKNVFYMNDNNAFYYVFEFNSNSNTYKNQKNISFGEWGSKFDIFKKIFNIE